MRNGIKIDSAVPFTIEAVIQYRVFSCDSNICNDQCKHDNADQFHRYRKLFHRSFVSPLFPIRRPSLFKLPFFRVCKPSKQRDHIVFIGIRRKALVLLLFCFLCIHFPGVFFRNLFTLSGHIDQQDKEKQGDDGYIEN